MTVKNTFVPKMTSRKRRRLGFRRYNSATDVLNDLGKQLACSGLCFPNCKMGKITTKLIKDVPGDTMKIQWQNLKSYIYVLLIYV